MTTPYPSIDLNWQELDSGKYIAEISLPKGENQPSNIFIKAKTGFIIDFSLHECRGEQSYGRWIYLPEAYSTLSTPEANNCEIHLIIQRS